MEMYDVTIRVERVVAKNEEEAVKNALDILLCPAHARIEFNVKEYGELVKVSKGGE